jgi:hypothetical protein
MLAHQDAVVAMAIVEGAERGAALKVRDVPGVDPDSALSYCST